MSVPPDPVALAHTSDFDADLIRSVQGLRGALTDLFCDERGPLRGGQDLSRRYGLNRNVAWKLTRIANTTDALHACQHLPGSAGMRIVFDSLVSKGARADVVARLRTAWDDLDDTIERYAGDRTTFELMLRSMCGDDEGGSIGASRKAAFEGNSAVWGVQARTLFAAHILAPKPDEPDVIDNGLVGGLVDFCRLRPTADWVLGRKVIRHELPEGEDSWEEPMADGPSGLSLLEEFSSSPLPALRLVQEEDAVRYVLPAGPVGRPGALTCAFGWIQRRAISRKARGLRRFDEHFLRIGTPARFAQLDLLIHRDLVPERMPNLFLYDLVHGRLEFPLTERTDFHLPLHETLEDLGQGPPMLASRHVPRFEALMRHATQRMGHPIHAFRAYRATLAYPPLPTALVVSLPADFIR